MLPRISLFGRDVELGIALIASSAATFRPLLTTLYVKIFGRLKDTDESCHDTDVGATIVDRHDTDESCDESCHDTDATIVDTGTHAHR